MDEDRKKITRSRAKCLTCGDVIESKHRHNFVSCTCGDLFLDGGRDYVRVGYRNEAGYELMTEYAEVVS